MDVQSLPSFFSMYQQLIAIPSISATDPKWDTSNKKHDQRDHGDQNCCSEIIYYDE